MIGIRYYVGGSSSGVTRSAAPAGAEAEAPLQVSSSCGDPVAQLFSFLNLGGRPCAYSFGGSGPLLQLTSFAARLLQGTSYGVWLGRLTGVGNTIQGLSVRYDAARQGIQLLRHDAGGVTASGLVTVASAGATQRWRVARTGQRALVWLNDRLVVNEPAVGDTTESGLLTDGAQVEVGSMKREKLEPSQAQELETMPPTAWPAAVPPPVPVVLPAAEPAPMPAEPAAAELPPSAGASVLRDYYTGVNGGGFEAGSYFAPTVTRYIGMRGTTPGAIQTYMERTFPRQFREARFEMDPSTYREGPPGEASYVERATYFNVSKNKYEKVVSVVQVRFDEQGRITALWQDKLLERSASDQPSP